MYVHNLPGIHFFCPKTTRFEVRLRQSISSSLFWRIWSLMANLRLFMRINEPSYLNSVLPNVKFFRKILAYLNSWEFFVFKRVFQPIQLFVRKCCSATPLSRYVTLKKKKTPLVSSVRRVHVNNCHSRKREQSSEFLKSPGIREWHNFSDGFEWRTIWHWEQQSFQSFLYILNYKTAL